MSDYVSDFMADLSAKNPGEPNFIKPCERGTEASVKHSRFTQRG